ncbi:MAG: alkane 1-monooxygenase [Cryomorphaceae bacterium]|nr:alkane 1-monooxygenase [Cryomorphaceae bacterium]
MKYDRMKYFLVYTTPIVVLFSLFLGGWYSFTAIVVLFGFIPFLELFTVGSTKNLNSEEEKQIEQNPIYDFLLYSLVPLQYIIAGVFLFKISDYSLPLFEKIGLTTAFGMACGVLGINAAHELGHRQTKLEGFLSKLLLASTQYLHFYIEHNRGHHKNVSTDEDPASAKYGESIYHFFGRSIINSWISAWKLEKKRLSLTNTPWWSIKNEMLRFQIIQLLILTLIFLTFNLNTVLFYLLASGIGILLLEGVNYIEHYGLRRVKKNGRYERTMPIHSWNSNHPIGRLLLLELSRHSDHHYISSRKYPLLRHFDESPQMPTGYPGMMLLALIPPLWFRVMHKRIEKYRKTKRGLALG